MKRGAPPKRKTALKAGKALKRSAMKADRKPLPAESPRRRSQRPLRAAVVAEVVKRDGGCIPKAAGAPGACVGPLTAHELVKRSQMRDAHLDPANCVASCWGHNGWIEDNPNLARELGLVKRPAPRVLP